MNLKYLLVFVMLIFCVSCKKYKLTNAELKWNPYKMGDVLTFQSNQGESYRIKVSSVDRAMSRTNPYAGNFSSEHEQLIVNFTYLDQNDTDEHSLFAIGKSHKGKGFLNFIFDLPMTMLLGEPKDILEADRWPVERKTINNKSYTDIIVYEPLSPQENDANFPFVTKLFWSKSKGYVRYELSTGQIWDLVSP